MSAGLHCLQVGGHVIAHASTVRLSLRKGKAEQRVMKVGRAIHCMHMECLQYNAMARCVADAGALYEPVGSVRPFDNLAQLNV